MDLLSSRPFWPIQDGLPAVFPPLERHADCDVAIIGAGMSGAMLACLLAEAGLDVVVLDRREAAHGSSAGNTGLMLYELDEPLHRLTQRIGREAAERAFRRCRAAIDGLERLVKKSRLECGFARRASLYLAATPDHVPRLEKEFAARKAAGLAVDWWSRSRLREESSLPHAAALCSRGAAELDAYRLAYGLLLDAQAHGARIHDRTEVTARKLRAHGVELSTSRGARVRARCLIVASGYEAENFLPKRLGSLHSTFAFATEPVAEFSGWPASRCLLWDSGDPYLYLRTTPDNRVIMGGYDEPFRDPRTRDRLLPAKITALKRRFRQFFPRIPLEIASGWAGTFGITVDGLPYIGQHPAVPHTWFVLGFGGNGTTFSVIAAELIRDALLGHADPDSDIFGFQRAGIF